MGDTAKMKAVYQEAINIVTSDLNAEKLFKIVIGLAKENPALLVSLHREENMERYEVVLDSYLNSKIGCIKAVRQLTQMGLKEAKDFVEDILPRTVATYVDAEVAKSGSQLIRDFGGSARVVRKSVDYGFWRI